MDNTSKPGGDMDPQRSGYPSRESGEAGDTNPYVSPTGGTGGESLTRRMDESTPGRPETGYSSPTSSTYSPAAETPVSYGSPAQPSYGTPPPAGTPYTPPAQSGPGPQYT